MGRWALTAVGISGVIGAGIYTLPASLAASLGPASLPAYLVAAAAILIFGHSMAVLGRAFEQSGGPYVYVAEALGEFWGFQVGWFFTLARLTALGAVTNVFVSYLARFVPAAATGAGRAVAVIASLGVLTALNVAGIRGTARVMNLFAIAKIVPMVAFAAAGAFFADWSRLRIVSAPAPAEFGHGLLLLIFAFGGFEFLTVPAEEARNPAEHVPFALIAAIACCSLLFVAVQAVALATTSDLGRHPDALSYAAQGFAGAAGALFMAAGAITATTGTNLANILVTSRMLYAFSRDGLLPRRLGALHPRFRTPATAVVLTGSIGIALTLSGSFAYLAALSAAARLVVYGACCAAVLRLRAGDTRNESSGLPGGLPAGPAGKAAALQLVLPGIGTLLALALIAMLPPTDLLLAAAAPVAGALVYFLTKRAR